MKEIKSRNIKVGYTPNILMDATAELTVALLLAASLLQHTQRQYYYKRITRLEQDNAWAPFWMCGQGLSGSNVGIVGFCRIGQEIAKDQQAQKIDSERVSFDELLSDLSTSDSDFVIVRIALSPEPANIFNEDEFMKPTSVFINTSREDVVDQNALISAK
ncbi:D-isomer specific 2-hydroxyacid dehydrogenase, NAD binding domain [Popillia japonica]|uniref:D-isomer specific 2-hydroxyacid dehydrogenase, NAD binding domain n=1 Tax=Popillia japonica TaxID=7064 RepID=A0AAW1I888_POPJA